VAEEFDRLIELIVVEQRKMLEQNRELLAQARARE